MMRRLFILASALSLLLSAATAVFWVRSYRVMDYGGHYRNHWDAAGCHVTAYGAQSEQGGIRLFWFRRLAPPAMTDEWFRRVNPECDEWNHLTDEPRHYPRATNIPGWYVAGFGFYHGDYTPPMEGMISNDIYVLFPDWLIIAASAGTFFIWCRRRIVLQLRAARRRCLLCGYDLRASRECCPECGTAIPSKAGAVEKAAGGEAVEPAREEHRR